MAGLPHGLGFTSGRSPGDVGPGRAGVCQLTNLAALYRRIDGLRDELVALTQDLVRFPTVNPPGEQYQDCAEFIGKWAKQRGFAVQYIRGEGAPGDSGRYPRVNVLARAFGDRPGPCIHFNSHIDVVEVGNPAAWTVDPFAGVVRDGRVYGRGACDMKGGMAASMIAIDAILQSGIKFPGALEISGTVDEESGGYGGVAYLAERGHFSAPRVSQVIIPEPLNVDRVCIGHRGVWWAEIETHGQIAHGSMPFLGNCAVRHMGAVLEAFESELIPNLAKRTTAMPVVPAGARASTLNLAAVHGGLPEHYDGLPSPNVPDRCSLTIDRRFLVEENLVDVKSEVRAILERLAASRPGFSYSMRDVMEVLPSLTDRDSLVVKTVSKFVEAVVGKPAQHVCSPGTYDQKHIQRLGQLRECIAYGPGILDMAHQPDEYVEIDAMVQSAKVMAASALELLGVEVAHG